MNYWKKMALALALVAGLCGGAWSQDWGRHDANRARKDSQWSARDHARAQARDRNHDRDWSYRNNPNYRYRNGQWGYTPNRTWGSNYGYYPYGNSPLSKLALAG